MVAVLQILRIQNFDLCSRNMFSNGQISIEGSVAVFFVDWKRWVHATRTDKQFLKPLTLTDFSQRFGMAVIEMFVADEDVVIHRLNFFQVVTKEVRIKSKVDIA